MTSYKISFFRYIKEYARFKGFPHEKQCLNSQVLELLLKDAGIKKRELDYYSDPEIVKKDLESFAAKLACVVDDLQYKNLADIEITSTNNEHIKGVSYFGDAGRLFVQHGRESDDRKEILNDFKSFLGFEVIDESLFPQNYFDDPVNIFADFLAYTQAIKLDSPADLTTKNMRLIRVKCRNGKDIQGGSYLGHAGVALGLGKRAEDANHRRVLDTLKTRIFIPVLKFREDTPINEKSDCLVDRSASYYLDPDNCRHDLNEFAKLANRPAGALKFGNIENLVITCKDGKRARGQSYLRTGAVTVGLAKNTQEAATYTVRFLEQLKKIAGLI